MLTPWISLSVVAMTTEEHDGHRDSDSSTFRRIDAPFHLARAFRCFTGQYPTAPETTASNPIVSAISSAQNGIGSVTPRIIRMSPPMTRIHRSTIPTLRIIILAFRRRFDDRCTVSSTVPYEAPDLRDASEAGDEMRFTRDERRTPLIRGLRESLPSQSPPHRTSLGDHGLGGTPVTPTWLT